MHLRLGLICLGFLVALLPMVARADGSSIDGKDRFGGRAQVNVTVTSSPTGVYIQISVKETVPGSVAPAPSPVSPSTASSPTPAKARGAPSNRSTGTDKVWSDATGIYEQTSDGHLYYLTVPNISSQSDWPSELRSHPNQTPYALYVDNQFQTIIWISNRQQSSNVTFGAPPAPRPNPGPPPGGNDSSTDPYQVALSLLDHIPLPAIQIKENPALGLVNLPGWFWIDGYDGKPFGASRTVTIPPAVGPNVPFTRVPKDDPRRQPTSFTVSVQLWPTNYQWSFGDGSSLETHSLGQAYPAPSDIAHTYQFSSLRTPGGFPIKLTVDFAAQYQINGGAVQGLPPISHDYTATYPVQEAQALLTSH